MQTECLLSANSGHRLSCSIDCGRKLSVPAYFMAGALPLSGIFICISAGIAAPPYFLKVGWRRHNRQRTVNHKRGSRGF